MTSIGPIVKKEIADHLSGKRFLLVFAIIFLSGLSVAYLGAQTIERIPAGLERGLLFLALFSGALSPTPSFIYFLGTLGPIIGIALGFDAINREIASGSLLRVLSNPIYRDAIINGKIIAGMATIALMIATIFGTIFGLDILLIGFGPTLDAVTRILYFAFVTILYIGLWMNLSVLFSIIFKRTATSALACITIWIFFSFFIYVIAYVVAGLLVPLEAYYPFSPPLSLRIAYENVRLSILRVSPVVLFTEIASILLNPHIRSLGPIYIHSPDLPVPEPLSVDESIILAWPHISALLAGFTVCFILSYIAFMRQEIRPTWA